MSKMNVKEKTTHLCSYLSHGVSVPERCSVGGLVHCVKVNGDAKSHTNLISPCIAPSNGPRGIIHFMRHAIPGQSFRYPKQSEVRVKHCRNSQHYLNINLEAQETQRTLRQGAASLSCMDVDKVPCWSPDSHCYLHLTELRGKEDWTGAKVRAQS